MPGSHARRLNKPAIDLCAQNLLSAYSCGATACSWWVVDLVLTCTAIMRRNCVGHWMARSGCALPVARPGGKRRASSSPDQPHELDAGAVHVALLYLDAQSTEYAAYIGTGGYSNVDIAELPALPETSPLRQLMASGGTCAQAEEAAQVILGLPADVGSSPIDPRIARALRWIDGNLQGPIRITRVAEVAGLSESHFAHLFVKMTGVPVRRYVLWRRLGAAVAAATRGASLTEAAYAAGLADSSHLSRAFRSTFGLAPSFLFEHRALLDGQVCERATSSVSHE